MSKRIGRNAPCPCGSGKKYKHCHLRHENVEWRREEATKVLRSAFSMKYCLHPEAGEDACGGDISKAHSVSLSVLKKISRDGHVYGAVNDDTRSIYANQGRIVFQLVGIRKASTFTGFCNYHDNAIFRPIDHARYDGSLQHFFLHAYRGLCLEIFAKKAILAQLSESRNLLGNYPPSRVPQISDFLLKSIAAHSNALQKMDKVKEMYDRALLDADYSMMRSLEVKMTGEAHIVCSGVFYPHYDFSGEYVQNITTSRWEDCASMSYTLLPVEDGCVAFLSWPEMYDAACNPFADSLLAVSEEFLPSCLINLAFEHIGNLYLSPGWWEGLERAAKDDYERRFQNGLTGEVASDNLRRFPVIDCGWGVHDVLRKTGDKMV